MAAATVNLWRGKDSRAVSPMDFIGESESAAEDDEEEIARQFVQFLDAAVKPKTGKQ